MNKNFLSEKFGILTADNVLLFLGLHLVIVNMKILHDLSPKTFSENAEWVFALLFAVSYAFATIYILRQNVPRILKVSFGLLDGCLIFLWYFENIAGFYFSIIGASLFAMFTITITLSIGFLKYEKDSDIEIKEAYEKLKTKYKKLSSEQDETNKSVAGIIEKLQKKHELQIEIKTKNIYAIERNFIEKAKQAEDLLITHNKLLTDVAMFRDTSKKLHLEDKIKIQEFEEKLSNLDNDNDISKIGCAMYLKSQYRKTKRKDKLIIANYLEEYLKKADCTYEELSKVVQVGYLRIFSDVIIESKKD